MGEYTMQNVYYAFKSLLLLVVAIIFTYGVYSIYKEFKSYIKVEHELSNRVVELAENIKSVPIDTDKKELKDKILELDQRILALIEKRNQDVKEIGIVITSLKTYIKELPSHIIVDNGMPSRTMDDTLVYFQDADGGELPVAQVFYNPFYDGDKWTTRTYNLKFSTSIALGENKDGSDAYVTAWMQNDDIQDYKGKKFPVKIENVNWIRQPLKDKKFMYNTRISETASIGTDMYIGLGLSFFSYGRTKRDMDWTFLKLNLGGNKDYAFFSLSPVEYNIGNYLPLVDNIFIGPTIGIDNKANKDFGCGISIPF